MFMAKKTIIWNYTICITILEAIIHHITENGFSKSTSIIANKITDISNVPFICHVDDLKISLNSKIELKFRKRNTTDNTKRKRLRLSRHDNRLQKKRQRNFQNV